MDKKAIESRAFEASQFFVDPKITVEQLSGKLISLSEGMDDDEQRIFCGFLTQFITLEITKKPLLLDY